MSNLHFHIFGEKRLKCCATTWKQTKCKYTSFDERKYGTQIFLFRFINMLYGIRKAKMKIYKLFNYYFVFVYVWLIPTKQNFFFHQITNNTFFFSKPYKLFRLYQCTYIIHFDIASSWCFLYLKIYSFPQFLCICYTAFTVLTSSLEK